MRRLGRTTRLVDNAIQTLFQEGEIFIPDSSWLESNGRGFTKEEIEKRNLFIDVEGTGFSQKYFLRRLMRRLNAEHPGQAILDGNWIKLIV